MALRIFKCVKFMFYILLLTTLILLGLHHRTDDSQLINNVNANNKIRKQEKYATFCSDTPNGETYRGYDYAFYLPLTALAWEKIGFKSLVVIIGSRNEWEREPALNYVLSSLEERKAEIFFVDAIQEERVMLSQVARLFVTNFKDFQGNPDDYVITTDADLWPLRKEHFMPRRGKEIVLVHSKNCCGPFKVNDITYPNMYPMSNIGALVSTWRDMLNYGQSSIANSPNTILNYMEEIFGPSVRIPTNISSHQWFMDQKMISVRLTEWMMRNGNKSVFEVSDEGFGRVDRIRLRDWEEENLTPDRFATKYDAHMMLKGYLPIQWHRMKLLIERMYGNNSWQSLWCDKYAKGFLSKVKNYVNFTILPGFEDVDYYD